MTGAAVRVHDLTVRYGDILALDAVSAAFGPGLSVVIGVNGSGKTSLLRTIAGVHPHAVGAVVIGGEEAARARAAGAVAFVPQADGVDWGFPVSVADVVEMGRYGRREGRGPRREAAAAALDRVGMGGHARRQIGELSGGQRRRVFLARAIAQEAPVLVLDEPLAGVDTTAQTAFHSLLRGLADEGRTVIMSTHDLGSIPDLAGHVVVLHQRVLAAGSPAKVLTPAVLARAFEGAP